MLSILIPCRNEADNVRLFAEKLIPSLDALGEPYEIVLVDDGSSDGTWREIKSFAANFSSVRAVRRESTPGLGLALAEGIALCNGDWIAALDADLTFAPAAVADLLACQKRTRADMVSGSPFLGPAPSGAWRRRFPSRVLNAIYGLLLDRRLTSYTPMFRLYNAQALKGLNLRSRGFEINAEIAAAFLRLGLKIAETPAALSVRVYGKSKLRIGPELGRHARLILRILSRGL